ncbi:MAG: pyrroline-5-carboxylate reductase [Planctomycetes bacterium]|nr:pyrroline-5-carboxylate reductase [Planctomycetota bacterium]
MSNTLLKGKTIGFIGAGNMAEAILNGILSDQLVDPGQVSASDPSEERRQVFQKFGCKVCDDNGEVASATDILILAVKPQVIEDVIKSFSKKIRPSTLVISIAAGVSCARLEKVLPENTHLVRVMPNTPIMIGNGVSVSAPGIHATQEDLECTAEIFSAGGISISYDDEEILHAVTALSGSGPAYVYYFIEALIAGGIAAGLPEEVASACAKCTVMGAVNMTLHYPEEEVESLRQKVTSPGGTTAAALESLKKDKFMEIITKAILAAKQRSIELGS